MTSTPSDQKLFEDIDERWQRTDEWSFPKSISIGWPVEGAPMAQDFLRFSDQYYQASRSICEMVSANKIEDYVASFPVIYLYRHSVELALKAILLHQTGSSKGGHDLAKLTGMVKGLPEWAKVWIAELHRLDERSTGLRYPDTDVAFFEAGSLLPDWLEKTEKLHSTLIALSQARI